MSTATNRAERGLKPASNSKTTYIRLRPLKDTETMCKALSAGDSISGVLSKIFTDSFDKTNYVLEQPDGSEVVIANAGNLASQMASVTVGDYVEIEYQGTGTLKSGKFKGKPVHQFAAFVEEK